MYEKVSTEMLHKARRSAQRTRAALACRNCKDKKVRCSGFQPCTRCKGRCIFDQQSKKRAQFKIQIKSSENADISLPLEGTFLFGGASITIGPEASEKLPLPEQRHSTHQPFLEQPKIGRLRQWPADNVFCYQQSSMHGSRLSTQDAYGYWTTKSSPMNDLAQEMMTPYDGRVCTEGKIKCPWQLLETTSSIDDGVPGLARRAALGYSNRGTAQHDVAQPYMGHWMLSQSHLLSKPPADFAPCKIVALFTAAEPEPPGAVPSPSSSAKEDPARSFGGWTCPPSSWLEDDEETTAGQTCSDPRPS
jgi:hypothetical protein